MPERSRKRPRNVNELAARIVEEVTGDLPPGPAEQVVDADSGKNPAAVALGRMGGLKGGHARADRMTPEERSEAARRAAQSRWNRDQ
jgi:hypothetical protein